MASEINNKTTSSEMGKKSVEIKCNKNKNSIINKVKTKLSVDCDVITSGDNKLNAIPLKRKNNNNNNTNTNANNNNKVTIVKKMNADSCVSESEHKTTNKRFKVDEKIQINENSNIKNEFSTTHALNPEIKVLSKPPLPPKPDKSVLAQLPPHKFMNTNANQLKMIKRKHEDNKKLIVQKLTAQADQLRLEITELKAELANEKNAVRGLR